MRARAATARNDSSWHDDAASSRSCSGLSCVGSPRKAGSELSVSDGLAGGADAEWFRSYASYPTAVEPSHAHATWYSCTSCSRPPAMRTLLDSSPS